MGARPAPVAADDLAEVPPLAHIPRRRLAVALAATVLALPVLVLDNLPASAERSDQEVATRGVAAETAAPEGSGPAVTAADATTTTVVVTSTTAAPPTTAAPAEPEPPAAAEPAAAVATLRAPAPAVAPTTTTTAAPAPAPASAPASTGNGDPNDPATWDRMAQCEAGGNWAANTGNGYYGGLQFSLGTWQAYGGTGYPHQASKATQIAIGKRLQADKGWAAWPGCARQLGYL